MKRQIKICLTAFVMLYGVGLSFSFAAQPTVSILGSSDTHLELQVKFPDFDLIQSETGYDITIPGCSRKSQIGAPQLPVWALQVAVPPRAHISISSQPIDIYEFSCFNITPAPVLAESVPSDSQTVNYVFKRDDSIYNTSQHFPASWYMDGEPYQLRSQKILPVRLFPVQYNPVTGHAQFAQTMIIRVRFTGASSPTGVHDPKSLDWVKRLVCNPEQAEKWQFSPELPLKKPAAFPSSAQPWVKIRVPQPGLYQITAGDLQDMGVEIQSIDPGTLQLFLNGAQVPIEVVTGHEALQTGDKIRWGVARVGTEYTRKNTYWLTWGAEQGERIHIDHSFSEAGEILVRGPRTIRLEQQTYYLSELEAQPQEDHWFWERLMSGRPFQVDFEASHVSDTAASAQLDVEMLGYVHLPDVEPDHHTVVSVNGNQVISELWDGRIRKQMQNTFPLSDLKDGENTIDFDLQLPDHVPYDFQFLDNIELTWWQDYIADSDSVWLTALGEGEHRIRLRGLSHNDLRVYAFENNHCIKRITNVRYSESEPYSLLFSDSLSGERHYLIVRDSRRPDEMSVYSPVDVTAPQTDYIIVSHADFIQASQQLAEFHRSRGLSVQVVDVQSVYDKFNYGHKDPSVIKDFISYAYHNWPKPSPLYLLLMGDASYDYLNYTGNGETDYVPTHLFISNSYSFETASDSWFGCVSGSDLVPDLYVGRLPVKTAEEAQDAVLDIMQYHKNPQADWQRSMMFVSDDSDIGGDFEGFTQKTVELVPDVYQVSALYAKDMLDETSARAALLNALNQGQLIVNYIGHGSRVSWAAQPRLFHITDIPNLQNNAKMPLVMTQSCINGYFIHPDPEQSAMGEVFMTAGHRGAIAVYTGAGYAYLSPLRTLTDRFYQALLRESIAMPAAAATLARAELLSRHPEKWDHALFYMFFGDPALQMPIAVQSTIDPAWYSGTVEIEGEPAPQGAAIFARHFTRRYGDSALIKENGRFDSLRVPADNPYTPQRDGARTGDSLFFFLAVSGDTLLLNPVVEWQSGLHSMDFELSSTAVENDVTIQLYVNNQSADQWISGDPLPRESRITAMIRDEHSNIDPEQISLLLNDSSVADEKLTWNQNGPELSVSFSPDLPDGDYKLMVSFLSGPARDHAQSLLFRVQSSLALEDVLVTPNPLYTEGELTFMLLNDQPANIVLRCFTLAGRALWTKYFTATVGFNTFKINAYDQTGDRLANGVYLISVTAKDDYESVKKIVKMMLIQ
ncbi:MAG: C25 family cysteine peptidase [candidate division KSB1 bacterium]|nr:C25 family cysteine peptidase [candidate division KSB1 bacterium]